VDWRQLFEQLFREFWGKYGVVSALLLFGVVAYNVYIHRLWSARLRDKDREIQRLVEERNRLQDVVLPKRLSSEKKQLSEKKNAPKG